MEELEGVHDDAVAFIIKQNEQLMAKVNFLNQVDLFVRKLPFSTSW